jgi:hypothetical protein
MKVSKFKITNESKEGEYAIRIGAEKPFYVQHLGDVGVVMISDRPLKTVNLHWYSEKELEKKVQK